MGTIIAQIPSPWCAATCRREGKRRRVGALQKGVVDGKRASRFGYYGSLTRTGAPQSRTRWVVIGYENPLFRTGALLFRVANGPCDHPEPVGRAQAPLCDYRNRVRGLRNLVLRHKKGVSGRYERLLGR